MIKISTCFTNKIPTTGIIFRDEIDSVDCIYFPENPNKSIELLNKYRKKNYWDNVMIPQAFPFLSKKVLTNAWYKELRSNIPALKLTRKIQKMRTTGSTFVDLTPLSEQMNSSLSTRSKKLTMDTFFNLCSQFSTDLRAFDRKVYLIIDNQNSENQTFVNALQYYCRLNGNIIKQLDGRIEGIMIYAGGKFWPVLGLNKEENLSLNQGIFNRFLKDIHGVQEHQEESKEDSLKNTKEQVQTLYKLMEVQKKSSTAGAGVIKTDSGLEENPLEQIKYAVESNRHLKGNSFNKKLHELFEQPHQKELTPKEQQQRTQEEKKAKKLIHSIDLSLKELNKKYNGVIEIDEKLINGSSNSYYKPLDVIGFNDFHAYDRQRTEFNENLDEAMIDLIKSIEKDKDLGIKVLSIKPEITDNYKDRFKTFKIKIQHKDFGHQKPYIVKFHVPFPAQSTYLKLGSNNYIMSNQFYPRPVLKTKPNTVMVYTHYATCSIVLKSHSTSESKNTFDVQQDLMKKLKNTKKLKEYKFLEEQDAKKLIDDYGLPQNLNSNYLINFEAETINKKKGLSE